MVTSGGRSGFVRGVGKMLRGNPFFTQTAEAQMKKKENQMNFIFLFLDEFYMH